MRVISGLFDTHQAARDAVHALEEAGVSSDHISLVSNNAEGEHDVGDAAAGGAGIGAALGGAGGLLAGLGALAIPGIGPVVAGGWLASTLLGAAAGAAVGGAAGGIVGALTEAGISEADAHVYAEGIRRGGTLVTARVSEDEVDAAAAILRQSGHVDISERRSAFEDTGWAGFSDDTDPLTADEVREHRASYAVVPPVFPGLGRS
ncbi:hypothetical protein EMQ25_14960 [Arsenicitalea aurantiaca]|uniref:DUF1269 domain-containing protein n=1 Tax=Arsenicitalea aurantiaca TaxID=1783274 RepID=A0A433X5T9_9HYPH|nr:hypothetical protein [Arsenicitalea aurantiaca]RUT29414.1 hypothetical protein EMQ25_14960 [Arsenicitalea aurantiaca]